MSFAVFLLYVFLSFFRPIELFVPEIAEFRPMLVLWSIAFVMAASRAVVRKQIAARAIDFKLLFGFMLTLGLSLLVNGWAGGAFAAMNEFTTSSMLFVLVALNVTDLGRLKKTCAAVVLSMLIAAGFGIQAFHTGQYATQLVLRQTAPSHEDEDPSRAPPSSASEIPAQDTTGWYLWRVRGQGFLSDPNDFSQVLVMCLPLLWAVWRTGKYLQNLLFVLAPGVVMGYAIFLSQSRGAMLGAASLLFFLVRDWLGTTKTTVLMALGGAGFIAASAIGGRAISSKEQSAAERIEAWSVGLELLKWKPAFGVGYGNFIDHNPLTAHNSFVLCFAELGLVGYFLWIGMIVLAYKSLTAVIDTLPSRNPSRQLVALLRNSLVGFLVCAWFLSRTYQPVLYFLLALCISAWYCATQSPGMTDRDSPAYQRIHDIKWVKSTLWMMAFTIFAVKAFVISHNGGGGG
ncbi:O-antigen ligase family protein [Sphaerotilus sp.]|jgi:putative inorganic carbon (hco3(-)) transporter|uniref:O-antigen ligase family protein n=1 Tax=Sphaerotilus sp. TaxID=2093942 RepID=UPI0025EAB220|nr:O-antigen ligase family protein [Sphaerotilus sp.]